MDPLSPGALRKAFEETIRAADKSGKAFGDLTATEKDGTFSGYLNPKLDTLWTGFCLGVRHATPAKPTAPSLGLRYTR